MTVLEARDRIDPPTAQVRVLGGLLATCVGELGARYLPSPPAPPVPEDDDPADEPAASAGQTGGDQTEASADDPAEAADEAEAPDPAESTPEPAPVALLAPGPVATALLHLSHSYVERRGEAPPVDVAERAAGVPAPGWLLAVAVVRPHTRTLSADAVQLARAAGVAGHALRHCVAYVELAAELFAGRPTAAAIETATGEPAPRRVPTPALCGEPQLDALSIGIWALTQSRDLSEVVSDLTTMAPPAVRAAAAGLLGMRDGAAAVPEVWQAAVADTGSYAALATELLSVRHQAYLQPRLAGRQPVRAPYAEAGPAAGPAAPSLWSWSAPS